MVSLAGPHSCGAGGSPRALPWAPKAGDPGGPAGRRCPPEARAAPSGAAREGVVPPPRPAVPGGSAPSAGNPPQAARKEGPGSSPGPAARGGAGGPAAHGGGGGKPPRPLAPTPRRALPPHSWSFGSAHSLINPFGIIYKK